MASQRNSQKRGDGTLNVLLHGAFTFLHDRQAKRILALMPELPQHVYRAGSWLAETEIRGSGASYQLNGVKSGGTPKFSTDQNLLVRFRRRPRMPVPYATLKFPYPKQITSLRVAEVTRKSFSHVQDLVVHNERQHIATLQIFTYDVADENQLSLRADRGEDHYWEPVFDREHINLHIFSSEDHYHKPSSAQEDFNQCVTLVGVKLRLKTRFLPASEIPSIGNLPDGVAPEETEVLAVRTLRMARLGRLVAQKGDANLAWYGNDALDGDLLACGDCVVIKKEKKRGLDEVTT